MNKLQLVSSYQPTGDQPQAIQSLLQGLKNKLKNQVLLGVTGSGKTYTIAQVIARSQLPTLIISHNKTLAGQLYQEMRHFFPHNAVSYFVSYYDYYQPEAYLPATDTYIQKEAQINDLIDKLRLKTTANILERKDVITVASVSAIYNLGHPQQYRKNVLYLHSHSSLTTQQFMRHLVHLQYTNSPFEFTRGTFRQRGNQIDVYPAYQDIAYRFIFQSPNLQIFTLEPTSGLPQKQLQEVFIYPAKHFFLDKSNFATIEKQIRADLDKEYHQLLAQGHTIAAQRLLQRVNYDLEVIKEFGYVNGIENYSRYFDGRQPGDPPYSLIDYYRHAFADNWLCVIDESHITIPQLKGMYRGDRARKQTLITHGFRLRAALDNRPLKFSEFYSQVPYFIYVSATPADWEMNKADNIAQQLIRPTGIPEPKISLRPAHTEIPDLIKTIKKHLARQGRTLVTTLTKKTAEDLSEYLISHNIKAKYLHSDIKTLQRSQIIRSFRQGKYDVLVGVNLLREGLDLPEVTLVAILDADKQGFLRSYTALIQTMGRAARNLASQVILYADTLNPTLQKAIKEVARRRQYQIAFNKKHHLTPHSIQKPLRPDILPNQLSTSSISLNNLLHLSPSSLTAYDKKKLLNQLRRQMHQAAANLDFEQAIILRDKLKELQS